MYDFFANNSLYIVLAIIIVVWAGFGFYMISIDNSLRKLEKKVESNGNDL